MDEDRDKDRADGERYQTIEAEGDEDEDEDEDESIAPPRKRARTTAKATSTSGVGLFLDLEASVSDEEGDDERDEDRMENFIDDEDEENEDNENLGRANLLETLEALGISHKDNTVWTEAIARAQRRAREDSARRSGSTKGKEKDIGPPSLWHVPVRRGREEEIASLLGGRLLALEETPPIRSIVGWCANPGYILIKTDAFDHVNYKSLEVRCPPDKRMDRPDDPHLF
ncbi:hypothetical protein H0H92_005657 [Tricholoma furcatifolium]|nr:hypothetical protein H0H92_005657 [Tricholoma furcatifolium]